MTANEFRAYVANLLRSSSPTEIAAALTANIDWLTALPPAGDPHHPILPPLGALGIHLGASALLRTDRASSALRWMQSALEAHASSPLHGDRRHASATALDAATARYPNLLVVLLEASIAASDWKRAGSILAILVSQESAREDAFVDVALEESLLALPEWRSLGPLRYDDRWMFSKQAQIIETGSLDESKSDTWKIYADFLIRALRNDRVDDAVGFVRAKTVAAYRIEDAHYHFHTVCVLSHAGLLDEAVLALQDLIRRGFDMIWRFDAEAVAKHAWAAETGQERWLANLKASPTFETLRVRYLTYPAKASGGARRIKPGPFASIHSMTLEGKSRKRCVVSNKLISPGEPIYRMRFYHSSAQNISVDDPLIAAKASFESSELGAWATRHTTDSYAPTDFALDGFGSLARSFEHPDIARFMFDIADGKEFDVDAFLELVAEPFGFPMRFEWIKDERTHAHFPEDGGFVNDDLAGQFVNLVWIALKCGHGPRIFTQLAKMPPNQADPIYAMMATFERADCRAAAAKWFGLTDLPIMIETAFAPRPSLADTLAVAAFGRDNPRFAGALATAMSRYNLHIYSNVHPQIDWYLQDLEHYTLSRGSQLLYFFVHSPELVPELSTMLANHWLVTGVEKGAYDGYRNARDFFHRAAVMRCMVHAPNELPFWLDTPWIEMHLRAAFLRETRRLVDAYRKKRVPR